MVTEGGESKENVPIWQFSAGSGEFFPIVGKDIQDQ